jgi:hypothetical protein
MQIRVIGAIGEQEMEQQVNAFVVGKKVIDIKFTEWGSITHQIGGYTCYVMYDENVAPTINVQVKLFSAKGDQELQTKVNQFLQGKTNVEIKFTEWVEAEHKDGGYSALVIYEAGRNASNQAQQFNTI